MVSGIRYGINVPNFAECGSPIVLVELAVAAEEAGWDGFFVWDHNPAKGWKIPFVDPYVALTAIAVETERIRIGSLVTPLARYHPWRLARVAVSIDHLSNGRLILGVGLGADPMEFELYGENGDAKVRAKKLDEGLDILTGLWKGDSFSYAGEHYRLDEVTFLPRPVQSPRIPIWVAGYWPNKKPFRRAARYDGVVPGKVGEEPLKPDDLRKIISYIADHRIESTPFDVAVGGILPPSPEKGPELVQPWIDAGATWWIGSPDRYWSSEPQERLDELRKRIHQGPPEI